MLRLREEVNELTTGVQDDRRHLLRSHFIEPSLNWQKNQPLKQSLWEYSLTCLGIKKCSNHTCT